MAQVQQQQIAQIRVRTSSSQTAFALLYHSLSTFMQTAAPLNPSFCLRAASAHLLLRVCVHLALSY